MIHRHGYLFAVVCVAAATALFYLGRDYFARGQWPLLYLLIIGLVAGLSGIRPALLASLLAFLAWNFFFLPPFHTLVVHDPKDWLSLVVFLIVGIVMGLQTGRMREREAEALARERETALLNEFSAHLVSDTTAADLTALIRRATGAEAAVLWLPGEAGELRSVEFPAGTPIAQDASIKEIAEWVQRECKAVGLPALSDADSAKGWPVASGYEALGVTEPRRDLFLPLQTAARQEGVLYLAERSDGLPYSPRDAQLVVAMANQAAAFLERKGLQAIAVQADAITEADKLKTILVSSVSHELKTPLASLTATVSNLLEQDVEWGADLVRQELSAIQEDLVRLNSSIGALLDLSRLESAAWEPKRELYEFGEIVATALTRLPQQQRARVSFELPDDLPLIRVDYAQWTRVLQNLLENALSYSPGGSQVKVGARCTASEIRMWVTDEGPGIPADEREHIFDKFFRGKAAAKVPSGTGLGLAITREIVRFHGGQIWAEDIALGGTRMVISLPREDEDART